MRLSPTLLKDVAPKAISGVAVPIARRKTPAACRPSVVVYICRLPKSQHERLECSANAMTSMLQNQSSYAHTGNSAFLRPPDILSNGHRNRMRVMPPKNAAVPLPCRQA
jgi:hypothetical protein